MLLSIIIPFYNSEAYISRCIESLYHQGLNESVFEVILVNDGSTDDSMKICESFAFEHSNIKIISQQNQGLSVSRNVGINAAKGQFICFVDSDDFLAADGLSKVVPYCDEQPDVIRYCCKLIYYDIPPLEIAVGGDVTFRGQGYDYLNNYGLETFCSNYLYKKDFLLSNSLFFCPGIVGEDFRFMADVLFKNPTIIALSISLYNYMIREESISTDKSIVIKRKWTKDFLGTFTHIINEMEPFRESDRLLFQKCLDSLHDKIPVFFSRLLATDVSKSELKEMMAFFKKKELMPIVIYQQKLNRKTKWSYAACNLLYSFPVLYPVARVLYKKVYATHIYPRLDRDK